MVFHPLAFTAIHNDLLVITADKLGIQSDSLSFAKHLVFVERDDRRAALEPFGICRVRPFQIPSLVPE